MPAPCAFILRDRTLLDRVRRAFAVHNWVAQVKERKRIR